MKNYISDGYTFFLMGLLVGRRILNQDQGKVKGRRGEERNIAKFAVIDLKLEYSG